MSVAKRSRSQGISCTKDKSLFTSHGRGVGVRRSVLGWDPDVIARYLKPVGITFVTKWLFRIKFQPSLFAQTV